MKVIAINGSARTDGNTAFLIRHVFEELEEGIDGAHSVGRARDSR